MPFVKNSSSNDAHQPNKKGRRKIKAITLMPDEQKSLVRLPSKVGSRVSPHTLHKAITLMTDEQKSLVRSIGFGSILEMGFDQIPTRLGCYVVDHFRYENSSICLSIGNIKITVQSIHDMFGVPNGGTKIVTGARCKRSDTVTQCWRKQFDEHERVLRPKLVLNEIQKKKDIKEEDDKRLFVLNFLVLFVTCMVEGNQLGSCNTKFLPSIESIDEVSKLDWCGYILQCLIEAGKEWKGNRFYFKGSVPTLVLHYLDKTKCDSVSVLRKRPTVKEWTTTLLKEREEAELDEGGFGLGEILKEYNVEEKNDESEKKGKSVDEEGLSRKDIEDEEMLGIIHDECIVEEENDESEKIVDEENISSHLNIKYKKLVTYRQKLVSAQKDIEEDLAFYSQLYGGKKTCFIEMENKMQIFRDEVKSPMEALKPVNVDSPGQLKEMRTAESLLLLKKADSMCTFEEPTTRNEETTCVGPFHSNRITDVRSSSGVVQQTNSKVLMTYKRKRDKGKKACQPGFEILTITDAPVNQHIKNKYPLDPSTCHQCQKIYRTVVRCTRCKEMVYCTDCINNWYARLSKKDILDACPFCRGNCNCNLCLQSRNKDKGKRVADIEPEDSTPITKSRSRTRSGRRSNARKLNSSQVHEYLENYWLNLSEDKKNAFALLDPLWYTMYTDGKKEKVLKWMKKGNMFSKKYVIFPICQRGHWSVLIFCHFSEALGSESKTPCILLLDSLEKAEHSRQLEPNVRKLVREICQNLGMEEDMEVSRKMPFLVPKVPQQRDGEECGYLVLYFVKLFIENAPENFNSSNGYPYFMKRGWFGYGELDGFCKTLSF